MIKGTFLTIHVKESDGKVFKCVATMSNCKDEYNYDFDIENTSFSNFEISELADEFDYETIRAIEIKFSYHFRQGSFSHDNAAFSFEIENTDVPYIKRKFFSLKEMVKTARNLQSMNQKLWKQDAQYNLARLMIPKSRAGELGYVARLIAKMVYVNQYQIHTEGEGYNETYFIGHKEFAELPRLKVYLENGCVVCYMEVDTRAPVWAINPQEAIRKMERAAMALG